MSKKKLTIIGRGTAGALAVPFFYNNTDYEIDWIFDPNIKPQAVGEGANLVLPDMLRDGFNFQHSHLSEIDGSFKLGIRKIGWKANKDFIHHFSLPSLSYHFNATKLQNYIYNLVKDKVNIIENNVSNYDHIDSDYIFDCSGKPNEYDKFHIANSIPVNSVHVTQCYWDYPRFQYTLTIARPHGWVFGIPLNNRCSIGYLYNKDISSLEDIKKDVEEVFKEWNLQPSEDTNTFSFMNYYRKNNFEDRVAYNGNASFFLEPLEATSIYFMDITQRLSLDYWQSKKEEKELWNRIYLRDIKQIETMIAMHYYADTVYDTEFWKYAKAKSKNLINENLSKDNRLKDIVMGSEKYFSVDFQTRKKLRGINYGSWSITSFIENLPSLGIKNDIKNFIGDKNGTEC